MRFVENMFIERLRENESLRNYLSANPVSWENNPALIRSLLDSILSSQLYADYMAQPSTDYATDCEFWRSVVKNIILPSDDLAEALESMSIYWNDDLQIMGTFVLKTIKQFASSPDKQINLLPEYKDDEDENFGPESLPACRRKS